MMRKRVFVKKLMVILAAFWGFIMMTLPAYADESQKVMQALSDDTVVKIYVRGSSIDGESSYQIGNIPADTPDTYSIHEDIKPMRTLIMVDNSLSIPKNSREKVLEIVRAVIDGHGEKEQFRLATFDEEIRYLTDGYSTDYTALEHVVSSISFENLHTAATNVLYHLIDELNQEAYMGYSRIIIITDGVDDQPLGEVNREELNRKLEDAGFPIYAIGTNTGKNSGQLSDLFALSRLTDCEYCILEDASVEDIRAMTALDYEMTVCEAVIPDQAKTGETQNSRLSLADGTVLLFEVKTPFGIAEESEGAEKMPPETMEAEEPETVYVKEPVEWESQPQSKIPLWFPVAAGAVAVILVCIAVIMIVVLRKKQRAGNASAPERNVSVNMYGSTDTVSIDAVQAESTGNTVQVIPTGGRQREYRVILTDQSNPARTVQGTLVHEACIGRKPENQIVISDDTAVSGVHCRILCKNGSFFVEDMGSRNKTYVNGSTEPVMLEQLIVSGSTIKIGRATYIVTIKEI